MVLNRYIYIFTLLGLLMTVPSDIYAQKGQEVGGWIGISHYFGDLNTDYSLNDPGPAIGLVVRQNFNERLCLVGGINYARVGARDEDSQNTVEATRNLSFKSNVFDANLGLEFNFFTYIHGSKKYYYTPYATAGLVVAKFNPTAELNGTKYNLRDFNTETSNAYSTVSPGLAFGVGFKWDLNYRWSFNVGLQARRLTTDYLDDVSTVYPDFNSLQGGPTGISAQLSDRSGVEGFATAGRQRGNSLNNDTYAIIHISMVRFFTQLECPKVSKIQGF